MVAGNREIINDQMMVGISPYGKGVDSIEGELFDPPFFSRDAAQERFLVPKRDAIHAGIPIILPNRQLAGLSFADVTRTTMTVMLSSPPL